MKKLLLVGNSSEQVRIGREPGIEALGALGCHRQVLDTSTGVALAADVLDHGPSQVRPPPQICMPVGGFDRFENPVATQLRRISARDVPLPGRRPVEPLAFRDAARHRAFRVGPGHQIDTVGAGSGKPGAGVLIFERDRTSRRGTPDRMVVGRQDAGHGPVGRSQVCRLSHGQRDYRGQHSVQGLVMLHPASSSSTITGRSLILNRFDAFSDALV